MLKRFLDLRQPDAQLIAVRSETRSSGGSGGLAGELQILINRTKKIETRLANLEAATSRSLLSGEIPAGYAQDLQGVEGQTSCCPEQDRGQHAGGRWPTRPAPCLRSRTPLPC